MVDQFVLQGWKKRPWDVNGNENTRVSSMLSLNQATWKENKELDTPHKWLRAIVETRRLSGGTIVALRVSRKGFINPLAYETQIVKRLNSLQPY
jgi:hypothetical protein